MFLVQEHTPSRCYQVAAATELMQSCAIAPEVPSPAQRSPTHIRLDVATTSTRCSTTMHTKPTQLAGRLYCTEWVQSVCKWPQLAGACWMLCTPQHNTQSTWSADHTKRGCCVIMLCNHAVLQPPAAPCTLLPASTAPITHCDRAAKIRAILL